MNQESQKISVRIGGMTYNLVSGESEDYTRQIAARADEMIRRVTMSSPHLSQQMTTVLALVNAVDDLARQAGQIALAEQQRDAAEQKNAEIRAELAKLREINWEMKKDLLHLSALVREQERQGAHRTEPAHRAEPAAKPVASPAQIAIEPAAPLSQSPVPYSGSKPAPAATAPAAIDTVPPARTTAAMPAAPVPVMALPDMAASADMGQRQPIDVMAADTITAQVIPVPMTGSEPDLALNAIPAAPAMSATLTAASPAMPATVAAAPTTPATAGARLAAELDEAANRLPIEPVAAEPRPAATARILPPLGIGRGRDIKAKPISSPLKNWRPNPWADAAGTADLAEPAGFDTGFVGPFGGSPEAASPANPVGQAGEPPLLATEPPVVDTAPAVSAQLPDAAQALPAPHAAAGIPLHLDEMRQTGLEEYLSRYGQGRSIVQDLRPDDEP